jgi:hypothetical protein
MKARRPGRRSCILFQPTNSPGGSTTRSRPRSAASCLTAATSSLAESAKNVCHGCERHAPVAGDEETGVLESPVGEAGRSPTGGVAVDEAAQRHRLPVRDDEDPVRDIFEPVAALRRDRADELSGVGVVDLERAGHADDEALPESAPALTFLTPTFTSWRPVPVKSVTPPSTRAAMRLESTSSTVSLPCAEATFAQ